MSLPYHNGRSNAPVMKPSATMVVSALVAALLTVGALLAYNKTNAKLVELQDERNRMDAVITDLQKALEGMRRTQAAAQDVETLGTKVTKLGSDLTTLQNTVQTGSDKLKAEITAVKDSLIKLEADVEKMAVKVNAASTNNEAHVEQLEQLQSAVTAVKKDDTSFAASLTLLNSTALQLSQKMELQAAEVAALSAVLADHRNSTQAVLAKQQAALAAHKTHLLSAVSNLTRNSAAIAASVQEHAALPHGDESASLTGAGADAQAHTQAQVQAVKAALPKKVAAAKTQLSGAVGAGKAAAAKVAAVHEEQADSDASQAQQAGADGAQVEEAAGEAVNVAREAAGSSSGAGSKSKVQAGQEDPEVAVDDSAEGAEGAVDKAAADSDHLVTDTSGMHLADSVLSAASGDSAKVAADKAAHVDVGQVESESVAHVAAVADPDERHAAAVQLPRGKVAASSGAAKAKVAAKVTSKMAAKAVVKPVVGAEVDDSSYVAAKDLQQQAAAVSDVASDEQAGVVAVAGAKADTLPKKVAAAKAGVAAGVVGVGKQASGAHKDSASALDALQAHLAQTTSKTKTSSKTRTVGQQALVANEDTVAVA